jgi:molecular chaperone DnaK
MGKIIGIDLASTASVVACVINGKPEVIPNSKGNRTTPSVVFYGKDGEIKVGEDAKKQLITQPKRTVNLIKRFMGASYKDTKKYHDTVGYDIVEGPNDSVRVKIDDKLLTPQEISAQTLMYLKKCAEDYLGETVTEAVITVPAYFDDVRRQAVMEAAKIAGLDCKRIINEPTAASLAYGADKKDLSKLLIISDIGGSTSDFSIIDVADGVFEVIATNGDPVLGGHDLDMTLAKMMCDECQAQFGYDVSKDPMAYSRIIEAAEKAKIELSSTTSTEISLPYLCVVDNVPQHYTKTINRAEYEKLTSWFVDKLIKLVDGLISKSGKSISDIEELVGVGGSIRCVNVQEGLEKYFGKTMCKGVNPDEAIAIGAAIQGSVLSGESSSDILLIDVLGVNINVTTMGGIATTLIDGTTKIPAHASKVFSNAEDNQPAITVELTQGSRKFANDNKRIGIFNLDGLKTPNHRGELQIEISVDVDSNGTIKVSAVDQETKKENHITIESGSKLSDEELERMKKDAEEHAEDDKKRLERQEVVNSADSTIYAAEKQLKDDEDKLSSDTKADIQGKIDALKTVFNVSDNERDIEGIKSATSTLQEALWKASSEVAQAAQPTNESRSTASNPFDDLDPSKFKDAGAQ